MLREASWGRK